MMVYNAFSVVVVVVVTYNFLSIPFFQMDTKNHLFHGPVRHGGASAQDKAAEALFHSYFAKEKAPNDPEELKEAAKAAGLDSTSVHLAAKAMLPHVD